MNAYEKIEKIIQLIAGIVSTPGTFKKTVMDVMRGYSEATLNSLLAEIKEVMEANSEPASNAE